MAAPSKRRAFSPYSADTGTRSLPPQYSTYSPRYQNTAPTSAPGISSFPRIYENQGELIPNASGTYTSPSPHHPHPFNAEQDAHQHSLQEQGLNYQHSSLSSPSEGETDDSSSPTHMPFSSSTPTTPSSQTPQHHPNYPCHNTSSQLWDSPHQTPEFGYAGTPSASTAYDNGTPVPYFITNSPGTGASTPVFDGQGPGFIGTPSTPPSPLYPFYSSPDLTTPTSEACARYGNPRHGNAHDSPFTPFYFPMSGGSESGGALLKEVENHEASEEVHRLMADQEGSSKFPGLSREWAGFEMSDEERRAAPGDDQVSPRTNTYGFKTQSPAAERRTTPLQAAAEIISPRNNTPDFETRETPLFPLTPAPLAPAFSPHTSPPLRRRVYSNSNAYRHFVQPPGPSSPLPPTPDLPLPEPRYSENYSINPYDANVARAHQLLEEHMKNRWSSVLSANSALQHITGTSGMGAASSSRAPLETAAMTLMHIKTGEPHPRPLLPGFSTPMQSMDRMQAERAGRVRSLRTIYEEYVLTPHARAEELCSLSIHAVSGFFGGASSGGGANPQPARLQNELLAHFNAVEGGTALQFLEIDIANPTGAYNRQPFERWAFFVIALPMVCGPGGVDRGHVGNHEKASMVIAAPLREVVVDGGKAVQDVLGDGTACLRRDFVFGPGVATRVEFWDKYGRWLDVGERAVGEGRAEWLCAEVEGVPGGRMEEWGGECEAVVLEGVRRDVERWGRVRGAMQEGVCRIAIRVVDWERVEREERARKRKEGRWGEGEVGDWERVGGSSVKKRRRGR
ncbi:hypothetical protein VE03_04800 [Pseudogymnoascus sp. 23342-1-I1]|nr:hypothetical protein VE03_04800 [Pseudogymnoascus sp. 23342-1-I1]